MLSVRYVIPQLLERLHDNAEGLPAVMALEILDVLQHENRRTTGIDNADNIKEQRALRIAGKTVGASEGILFRHAGQRERLTREARQQDIMGRN